jgi:hypothetical protein
VREQVEHGSCLIAATISEYIGDIGCPNFYKKWTGTLISRISVNQRGARPCSLVDQSSKASVCTPASCHIPVKVYRY